MRALAWTSRHALPTRLLQTACGAPALPISVFGLTFPNPIGLAAGMDKHAEALPAWAALGFGFTELGAVTWHPQPGNPTPRVFRAIPEQAIVNRMGFNNPGAEVVARTLARWRASGRWPAHPVGMNIGKSKITPLDQAPEDYARSFQVLRDFLDFVVINVSSPNTPNLRQLQDREALGHIFSALAETATSQPGKKPPILVKVAPDLTFEALDEIVALVEERHIAGLVATNTTITRPITTNPAVQRVYNETGGLSGKPLRQRSTEVIRHLYRQTKGRIPIIGVGGIFNVEDAWEKIAAGASLLQVYTGFVYEGPQINRLLVSGLDKKLKLLNFSNLKSAIGCDAAA
jgi:dihydroorotate dehydrogenase